MVIIGGSDSIPMEVYFERYVQKAASEGYISEGTEEPDSPELNFRMMELLILVMFGAVSIILVVLYPKIHKGVNG